jgi:hypothetical protein
LLAAQEKGEETIGTVIRFNKLTTTAIENILQAVMHMFLIEISEV